MQTRLCQFARVGSLPRTPRPNLMAIYRCSLSTVSRSRGRTATAAAAYRSGTRIEDARTAEVHDFTARRRGIPFTAMVGWSGTRSDLWNRAEASERRRNAVVAREVLITLPRELSAKVHTQLSMALAQWLHETHGTAVDVAIHKARARDGGSQPHAHLLMTTRRVSGDGEFGAKTRELDEHRTGVEAVERLRATWAEMCNAALAEAGVPERLDHRSYARQGVDKEAIHVDRAAIALEEKGVARVAVAESSRAANRNARRKARMSPPSTGATEHIAPTEPNELVRRERRTSR